MYNQDEHREDPLSVARGIGLGIVIGALIWAGLLAGIFYWIKS